MGIIQGSARLQHHSLTAPGATFTVPTTEDFTDGSWLTTDLVVGEIGINITDDTAFFRTANGIIELQTSSLISGLWTRVGEDIVAVENGLTSPLIYPNVLPPADGVSDLGDVSNNWRAIYAGLFKSDQTSLTFGNRTGTAGTGSVVLGGAVANENEASGAYSLAEGYSTTASATGTYAGGLGSTSNHYGEWSRASTAGGQYGFVSFSKTSDGSTPVEVFLNASSARFTVAAGTAYRVWMTCIAVITSTGESKEFSALGIVKNVGGTTSLVGGTMTVSSTIADAAMTTATMTMTADDTNDALVPTITGIEGTGIKWFIKYKYEKTTF